MKLSKQSFFCKKGEGPKAHIKIDKKDKNWPVTLTLNSTTYSNYYSLKDIIFFMDLPDLISFKNSVIGSFEKVIRETKDV